MTDDHPSDTITILAVQVIDEPNYCTFIVEFGQPVDMSIVRRDSDNEFVCAIKDTLRRKGWSDDNGKIPMDMNLHVRVKSSEDRKRWEVAYTKKPYRPQLRMN